MEYRTALEPQTAYSENMKVVIVICALALLQHASSQCLPATSYCLSPPALEVLSIQTCAPTCAYPTACLPAPCACPTPCQPACAPAPCCPAELLTALAPILASTISSSLAATLPPLLEAALPTVLTSALAAAAPLLAALPPGCTCAASPIVYAAPACPAPTCIYL